MQRVNSVCVGRSKANLLTMLCSELKSLVVRVHHMLRKQPTLKADEVPKVYHEPGVSTGYRLPGQPLFIYVLSVLQLNNETVNVWTHLIGFVVILFRTLFLLEEFGAEDVRIVPLLGFGICSMLYTGLSAIAHMLHSASPSIHYTCFQADYAGIGLYAFGGALPVFYLSADSGTREYFNFWFLPVNFVFSWCCFLCCCIAKLRYRRPYPFRRKLWQIIPFGLHILMSLSFMYRRIRNCYVDETSACEDQALGIYSVIVLIAILAALTFSSHLPEKIWPGYFDLIGQGHQVFHALSVVLTLYQFSAALVDIPHSSLDVTSDHDVTRNDVIPSLYSIICIITGFMIVSGLTMVQLRSYVIERVKEDELLEKRND